MHDASHPSRETVETWLREESRGLRALSLGLLGRESDAEDAVQDTWLAALRGHPDRPGPWLRVVLRRLVFRRARGESRRRRREIEVARSEATPSASEVAEGLDLRRRVVDAVSALDEPYRSAVVLRYFHDRSPAQVAEIQGVPIATAKTRLHRALVLLRARLDEEHGGKRTAWQPSLAALLDPPSVGTAVATPVLTVGGAAIAMKKLLAVGMLLLLLGGAGVAVWQLAVDRPESGSSPVGELRTGEAPDGLAARPVAVAPKPPAGDAWVLREGDAVPDSTFAGRVVDESGAGVMGARVRLHWFSELADRKYSANGDNLLFRRERERREAPAFTTNREGYFRLDRPYTSVSYVRVEAQGFASAVVQGPSGRFVLVRLKQVDALSVRVLTQEGAPVAGAEVRLISRWDSGGVPGPDAREILASASTDPTGRAELPSASENRFSVEVLPAEPNLGIVQLKSVENGAREVEVRVPFVKTYVRHVVDADTGRPLADAYVDVLHEFVGFGTYSTDLFRRRLHADSEGKIEIPVQDGTTTRVSAPGYEVAVSWSDDPIRLVRAMRIEGVVRSADGAPVSDAALFLVIPGIPPYATAYIGASPVVAFTDAQGQFDFEVKQGWPPYGEHKPDRGLRALIAAHPAHLAAAVEPSIPLVPGSRVHLDLRFPRPAAIEVLVVDAEGKAVAAKSVRVRRLLPWPQTWPAPRDRNAVNTGGLIRWEWATTDAQGRAKCEGLPPGPHEISVENSTVDVEAVEGQTTQARVVLGAGPFITGRVLAASGDPAADMTVQFGGPNSTGSKTTDKQGRFRFDDLVDGEYRVYLSVPMLGPRREISRRARPGDDVTLRIPAGLARLRLHVEGAPQGTAAFQLLTSTGGYLLNQDEAARGKTNFIPIPTSPYETEEFIPGPGRMLLRAEGLGMRLVAFEASEKVTSDVRVSFEVPGAITGRVLVPKAGTREIALLMIAGTGVEPGTDPWIWNNTQVAAAVAEDRTYRFPALQPGSYDIRFMRWDDGRSTKGEAVRVEVRSGETTQADIGL